MPSPLLTFLKYLFLAVLYLFFLRVLRAVWVELREPKVVKAEPVAADPSPGPPVGWSGSTSRGGSPITAPAPGAMDPTAWAPGPNDLTGVVDATGVSPPSGSGRPRLVVQSPPEQQGVSYPLSDELTVGRAPGCAVSLPDTFVSQVHARVFRRDDRWWVEDLGSTNGTLLNDSRVTSPVAIRPGDRLQFGQTVMGLDS